MSKADKIFYLIIIYCIGIAVGKWLGVSNGEIITMCILSFFSGAIFWLKGK